MLACVVALGCAISGTHGGSEHTRWSYICVEYIPVRAFLCAGMRAGRNRGQEGAQGLCLPPTRVCVCGVGSTNRCKQQGQ